MDLVDTDVLIEVERGNKDVVDWFRSLPAIPYVPGLVVLEMLQGVRNKADLRKAKKLVDPLPVLWPTAIEGEDARLLLETYKLSNSLGMIDSLIAAMAIRRGATLYTLNHKHFKAIPGLKLAKPIPPPKTP